MVTRDKAAVTIRQSYPSQDEIVNVNHVVVFVVTTRCNLGDRSEHYNMNIHRHETLKSLPTK
jgi:hypothetical protein